MILRETFFGVETDGIGDTLDGGFGVMIIVETRDVATNDFGESDGLETEWGIGGSGDFAGVATVFVENEATVGFFEPLDSFEIPAMDELVFVIENIEVATGGLHDVGEKVEMVGGEILGFVDDNVLELVVVAKIAK